MILYRCWAIIDTDIFHKTYTDTDMWKIDTDVLKTDADILLSGNRYIIQVSMQQIVKKNVKVVKSSIVISSSIISKWHMYLMMLATEIVTSSTV